MIAPEEQKRGWEIQHDSYAFRKWLSEDLEGPDEDHNHALRLMATAIREELSEIQREYINCYYFERLTMDEIGERYGVSKSTVSRTITRGKKKLEKVLRYSSKRLLRDSLNGNLFWKRTCNKSRERRADHV